MYQKHSFQETASRFEASTRDFCQAELAHDQAILESDAFSVMNTQRAELGHATEIVTNLREHLSQAQRQASTSTESTHFVEKEALAELHEQRAAALQLENALKHTLEQEAQASHERIIK